MQAVINAAREYGFFVNRGDPVAADYATGDFIKNSTWQDLDLSAIVPVNAHGILFAVVVQATAVNHSFLLRPNGNANTTNSSHIRSVVANLRHAADFACPCDSDRKVEYLASVNPWTILNLTVKGWWY